MRTADSDSKGLIAEKHKEGESWRATYFNKRLSRFFFFACHFFSLFFPLLAYAAPSQIDLPVNLSDSNGQYCISINSQCTSGWSFWQHKTGFHHAGGGIGGANDYYAWDINLNSPTWNSDAGKPVYAVESGTIHTGNSWGGDSAGQLLINHTTGGYWSSTM